MASHIELGKWGEELAADLLERKGMRILERDWRSGHRDIDIVARTADELVFVEVKTRESDAFGEPWKSVDWRKRKNILASINQYIRSRRIDMPFRFDIVSVTLSNPEQPQIEHIENVQLVSFGCYSR